MALTGIRLGAQAVAPNVCVMINETGTPERLLGNATECATRLSPASTYKIPHALIGLETGVITETTVVKWDGGDGASRGRLDGGDARCDQGVLDRGILKR